MKNSVRIAALLSFTALLLTGCNGEGDQPIDNPEQPDYVIPAQITAPFNEDTFVVGQGLTVEIKVNKPEAVTDLKLFVADTLFADNLTAEGQTISINTERSKVGWVNIQLAYTDDKGKSRADNRKVALFSDIEPAQKKAVIVATYPHAKASYTQGLEFYKGKFFEGTGQYNQSILAEVDLTSGTKLREHALDGSIFGEGITVLNDTIYQLTYTAGICYVYDMDFNLLNEFSYTGQGWGLCNDGKHLLMSNGTDQIVWRDPKTFEIVKSIYVFDNAFSLGQLNELELIDGNLFLNVYTENRIAEIDTATGKVLTYIDCNDLVKDASEPGMDVLNGIAHNPATGKTYMTGKWWSKLYEVKFE